MTEAASNGVPGKLDKKVYERELYKLQVELVKVQDWVKATGARIVILFEGRDAAGKGGVIKRITQTGEPACLSGGRAPGPHRS